jgi:hypothetical protein
MSIPAGRGLLSPCNRLLKTRPQFVYLSTNATLYEAIENMRALLRESTMAPTRCRELTMAWPDYVGVCNAFGHGVGGIIIEENSKCPPTVFRYQWPEEITVALQTQDNPKGTITNSGLELAGLLLLWLIMEKVCPDLKEKYVALFSNNTPIVSWVTRLASKKSRIAELLVRALVLCLKMTKTCPLTPLHIAGSQIRND